MATKGSAEQRNTTPSPQQGDPQRTTRSGYDRIAGEYAKRIYSELDGKPLDRHLLNRFAESLRDRGVVCDLGCGPGHVTKYLHDQGVEMVGVDLSPGMIAQAKRLNPAIDFRTGDIRCLNVASESWAGIVAFYSLIHIAPADIAAALSEVWRVLRPGGLLFIAFHVGTDRIHLDEWWGHTVSLDFFLFERDEMLRHLRDGGFHVNETTEREPYEGVEHPSRRCYMLAEKREGPGSRMPHPEAHQGGA